MTKFGGESHTYDIDLHPKNEKNPFENLTGRGYCGRTDRHTDVRTDGRRGGDDNIRLHFFVGV